MEIITELHKTNKTWICEGGIVRNKMQVKKLKEICETYKPKNILEIGFNGGHSSALMLEHTDACIVSVDICSHHYVFDAKEKIDDIFPEGTY